MTRTLQGYIFSHSITMYIQYRRSSSVQVSWPEQLALETLKQLHHMHTCMHIHTYTYTRLDAGNRDIARGRKGHGPNKKDIPPHKDDPHTELDLQYITSTREQVASLQAVSSSSCRCLWAELQQSSNRTLPCAYTYTRHTEGNKSRQHCLHNGHLWYGGREACHKLDSCMRAAAAAVGAAAPR